MPAVNVGDTFPRPARRCHGLQLRQLQAPADASSRSSARRGVSAARSTVARRHRTSSRSRRSTSRTSPGNEPDAKFNTLAGHDREQPAVAGHRRARGDPGQQRRDGRRRSSTPTSRSTSLIAAIQAAGGPTYQYRQIDPVDDQDGGEPGGNIRVGFLFRTDRGLAFVDRPGGDSTTPIAVVERPERPASCPPARAGSTRRTPRGTRAASRWRPSSPTTATQLFVIANHFNSKGGDQPLFGRFQPPIAQLGGAAAPAGDAASHDFVDDDPRGSTRPRTSSSSAT